MVARTRAWDLENRKEDADGMKPVLEEYNKFRNHFYGQERWKDEDEAKLGASRID